MGADDWCNRGARLNMQGLRHTAAKEVSAR